MIITNKNNIVSIVHRDIAMTIDGKVKLLYERGGLKVVVNSIPEMFFNMIPLSEITSEITIEV